MSMRNDHPEAALAVYVDGEASPAEREAVELHLAVCERCQGEVALAMKARKALGSLPALDAPPAAMDFPAVATVLTMRSRREANPLGRRIAVGLAAGAAAAAVIVAFVVLVGGQGGPQSASSTGGGLTSAPSLEHSSPAVPLIRTSNNYSPSELAALAALTAHERAAAGGPTPEPPATSSSPDKLAVVPPTRESATARRCVLDASGVQGATIVRLEEARFQNQRAFIAALVVPGVGVHELFVVAVAPRSCQLLASARAAIPAT